MREGVREDDGVTFRDGVCKGWADTDVVAAGLCDRDTVLDGDDCDGVGVASGRCDDDGDGVGVGVGDGVGVGVGDRKPTVTMRPTAPSTSP